jgi:flagellar hook-associated protein 3 FlgL
VRADETFETTYGITADEPAFEELLRALSYMSYAGANLDGTVLEEAYTMMKSAVDGLSDIRGRIGASSKVLESAKSGHEDYLTYATNLVSTLEDVDVAEATTRLAMDEVQLQASYLSLSRISQLSLLSYLR